MAEELNNDLIESHGIKRPIIDDDADHVFPDVIKQLDNGIEVKRRKSNFNDVQESDLAAGAGDARSITDVSSCIHSFKTIGGNEAKLKVVLNESNGEGDEADADRVSEISGISDISVPGTGRWHPMSRAMAFVHRQIALGCDPRVILRSMLPQDTDADIPDELDDMTLWRLVVSLVSSPPRRHRLPNVTTLDDVIQLLKTCTKVIVLTGAGVSVSCGIPDFRSANGIYARLAVDYPDLPNPQAMFDIGYFRRNPRPFFQFAKEIYPGQFTPSTSHKFIQHLEKDGRLLRNYTQNIDTLEQTAGISRVVQCHGSFATATCMVCKKQVDADAIRDDIMSQVIPKCQHCDSNDQTAIVKPDIVFFGESLPEEFHRLIQMDKDECDLLIVIGSSLKVQPVALIPSSLPAHVPQILINREPLHHFGFDVELLGDCDVIVNELCHRLGADWSSLCTSVEPAVELSRDEVTSAQAATPGVVEEQQHVEHHGSGDKGENAEEHENGEKVQQQHHSHHHHHSRGHRVRTSSSASGGGEHGSDRMSTTRLSVSETVETVERREQVLETIQRHDQDVERAAVRPPPVNWATLLKGNHYISLRPRRYVFSGAEVYSESVDSSSDSSGGDDDDDDDDSLSSGGDLDDLDDESFTQNSDDAAECGGNNVNQNGHLEESPVGLGLGRYSAATPPELSAQDSSNGSVDP